MLFFKKLIDIFSKKPQYLVPGSMKPHFVGFMLHKGPRFKGNMFQEELRCQRRKKQKRKRDNERRGQSLAGFFQRTNSTNLDQSKGPSPCEGPNFCIVHLRASRVNRYALAFSSRATALAKSSPISSLRAAQLRMRLQPGIVARRGSELAHGLRGQGRRIDQRRRGEVEELHHVVLRGITLG